LNQWYLHTEVVLLFCYVIRISWVWFSRAGNLDSSFVEVYTLYLICLANDALVYMDACSIILINFLHCAFPVFLIAMIYFKNLRWWSFVFSLILFLFILYFHDARIIVTTYLLLFIVFSRRIYQFSISSKRYREKVPVYCSILILLVITHLIFLMNNTKVDWHESKFVDYFLYVTQFVYLSTIILGHVYLRRFIVN